jgi:cell division protein FtsL
MFFNTFVAIMGCKFRNKEILKERNKKRKTEIEELKGDWGRKIRKKKHNKVEKVLFICSCIYFLMVSVMMSVSKNRLIQRRLLKV